VKSIKARRTSISRSATGIPTLVLLGALSGTALAATEIQSPCPETQARSEALHALLAEDAAAPLVRTVEATETATPAPATEADDKASLEAEKTVSDTADSSSPAYTTQLPGVSANDMPGFRRHMYRTDI
jgi:hypothetical protein